MGGGETRKLFEQEALPHLDALFTAALHLTRSEHDAKDLCQETVLRAYRFFHQFTPGTNCRAWLLTILYNAFRTGYARGRREQVMASVEAFERAVRNHSYDTGLSSPGPEAILTAQSMDHSVKKALSSLPSEFRTALLLVDVEELSYQEAAKVLDVPIGTVRSRLARGRALMRSALPHLARNRHLACA